MNRKWPKVNRKWTRSKLFLPRGRLSDLFVEKSGMWYSTSIIDARGNATGGYPHIVSFNFNEFQNCDTLDKWEHWSTDQSESLHFETQPGNRDVEEIILNQIIFDLITFKGAQNLYIFLLHTDTTASNLLKRSLNFEFSTTQSIKRG